jgi:hypothetical protein
VAAGQRGDKPQFAMASTSPAAFRTMVPHSAAVRCFSTSGRMRSYSSVMCSTAGRRMNPTQMKPARRSQPPAGGGTQPRGTGPRKRQPPAGNARRPTDEPAPVCPRPLSPACSAVGVSCQGSAPDDLAAPSDTLTGRADRGNDHKKGAGTTSHNRTEQPASQSELNSRTPPAWATSPCWPTDHRPGCPTWSVGPSSAAGCAAAPIRPTGGSWSPRSPTRAGRRSWRRPPATSRPSAAMSSIRSPGAGATVARRRVTRPPCRRPGRPPAVPPILIAARDRREGAGGVG